MLWDSPSFAGDATSAPTQQVCCFPRVIKEEYMNEKSSNKTVAGFIQRIRCHSVVGTYDDMSAWRLATARSNHKPALLPTSQIENLRFDEMSR